MTRDNLERDNLPELPEPYPLPTIGVMGCTTSASGVTSGTNGYLPSAALTRIGAGGAGASGAFPARFTADQMRAYAAQAVAAERERIALHVESMIAGWDGPYRNSGALIAAAIRK